MLCLPGRAFLSSYLRFPALQPLRLPLRSNPSLFLSHGGLFSSSVRSYLACLHMTLLQWRLLPLVSLFFRYRRVHPTRNLVPSARLVLVVSLSFRNAPPCVVIVPAILDPSTDCETLAKGVARALSRLRIVTPPSGRVGRTGHIVSRQPLLLFLPHYSSCL